MASVLGVVDFLVISVVLAASAAAGVYFRFTGNKQKTTEEFLMAGRNMSILPVAFSLMATYMSANSLSGSPAEIYLHGTQLSFFILMFPVGSLIAAYFYLPIYFELNVSTSYEYIEKRFGNAARFVVSTSFMLETLLYISVVLYAPSIALSAVAGISVWTSIITICIVCTFYCSLGGMKAVLWTDVLQSIFMYTTVLAIAIKTAMNAGGVQNVVNTSYGGGRIIFDQYSLDLTIRYTMWNTGLRSLLYSTNVYGTSQSQIQRLMSVSSLTRARRALLISSILIMLYLGLCHWNGLSLYSLFHDCDPILNKDGETTLTSPDQMIPYSILKLFGDTPGLSGLCISGIFSASLSSMSSALNAITAITVHNYIKPYFKWKTFTDSWTTTLAKVIGLLYGLLCLVLTIIVANFQGIVEASTILTGIFSGPVLALFTLGLFTTTANEKGAVFGLAAGVAFNAWFGFGVYSVRYRTPALPRSTEGCLAYQNASLDIYQINANELSIYNSSDIHTGYSAVTDASDIFPFYKVSYMWITTFGALVTFSTGYLLSALLRRFSATKNVEAIHITPLLRKLYFKTYKVQDNHKNHQECIVEQSRM